ncbi:hypothetical protein [Sphingosinicella xenopeptidilytica]|uniref:Polysaccharide chain length determinant N-terminal domain-containing protein n=1 Tax=Sphingosinicella xenopeptidilytica TaxID=364098 RepID=A0ABW3C4F8_SPHXN
MNEQLREYHVTPPDDQMLSQTSLTLAWDFLRRRLYLPIAMAAVSGVGAAGISLMFPDQYVSEAALAPSEYLYSLNADRSVSGSLGGRLLGLTGGGAKLIDPVDLTIEYAKSRDFVLYFIAKHNLAPELAAVSGWNRDTNRLIWDNSIYSLSTKTWSTKINGESHKPNETDLYRIFRERINITREFETGVILVDFRHVSPERSQKILKKFIDDLNYYVSDRQYRKSRSIANSLRKAIATEPLLSIKNELINSAIGHIRIMSMHGTSPNAAFDIIDTPSKPDEKDGPFRSLICLASAFAGGLLGLAWVLIKFRLSMMPK